MPMTPGQKVNTGTDLLDLVLSAGPATQGTLLILAACSVACWAVILYKWRVFLRADRANARFLALLRMNQDPGELARAAQRQSEAPAAMLFLEGSRCLGSAPEAPQPSETPSGPGRASRLRSGSGMVEQALEAVTSRLLMEAERYLVVLATTANAAPFIGLFGTVLGIITAFQSIARQGSASLSTVAPGIAEALIATAAGLLAAIPAVVAYNIFLQRIRRLSVECEQASREVMEWFERCARGAAAGTASGSVPDRQHPTTAQTPRR